MLRIDDGEGETHTMVCGMRNAGKDSDLAPKELMKGKASGVI